MPRQLLDRAVTLLMVLCALVVTGLVARREFSRPQGPSAPEPVRVENWRKYAIGQRLAGPQNAPVTIVEFSDFQCPSCAQARSVLEEVAGKYKDQVQVLYRHRPLRKIHPLAHDAAVASECAAEQGRFSEYHDALFARGSFLQPSSFLQLARDLGLPDQAGFAACLTGPASAARARVARDSVASAELDIHATPTILVNNTLIRGISDLEGMSVHVDAALAALGKTR